VKSRWFYSWPALLKSLDLNIKKTNKFFLTLICFPKRYTTEEMFWKFSKAKFSIGTTYNLQLLAISRTFQTSQSIYYKNISARAHLKFQK
jgi:hypothetical protein